MAAKRRTEKIIEIVPDITVDNEYLVGKSKIPVVISAYALWCSPCHRMEPIMNKLATDLKGVYEFFRLDVDDKASRPLAVFYGITAVPTFLFIVDNEIIGRETGFMTKTQLTAKMDAAFQKIEDEDY